MGKRQAGGKVTKDFECGRDRVGHVVEKRDQREEMEGGVGQQLTHRHITFLAKDTVCSKIKRPLRSVSHVCNDTEIN